MSYSPEDDEPLTPRLVRSQHCTCDICGCDPVIESTLTKDDIE